MAKPKVYGTVAWIRRGAECGEWCFSPAELEAAHRKAMEYAIEDLQRLKDAEPLRFQLDRRNPYFMDYPDAVERASLALQEKGFKGRGRAEKIPDIERNKRICLAVYLLSMAGHAIRSESKDRPDACTLVGEHKEIHLSAEQVYNIWNDNGEPQDRNLAPWEYLEIDPPSTQEILDYCLAGKFREDQAAERMRATIRYMVEQNTKQKQ